MYQSVYLLNPFYFGLFMGFVIPEVNMCPGDLFISIRLMPQSTQGLFLLLYSKTTPDGVQGPKYDTRIKPTSATDKTNALTSVLSLAPVTHLKENQSEL